MNKTQLKQIIKEEMQKYLNERSFPDNHGKATLAADEIGDPWTSDENKVEAFDLLLNIMRSWSPEEQATHAKEILVNAFNFHGPENQSKATMKYALTHAAKVQQAGKWVEPK